MKSWIKCDFAKYQEEIVMYAGYYSRRPVIAETRIIC